MAVSENVIGVDFDAVFPADTSLRKARGKFKLGQSVRGDGGAIYVFAEAGGAIAASQSDVAISGSYIATDGGGTYTGPGTAMVAGDQAWFLQA